jgi:hypothetical protein
MSRSKGETARVIARRAALKGRCHTMTATEAARELGMSVKTARADARFLGETFLPPDPGDRKMMDDSSTIRRTDPLHTMALWGIKPITGALSKPDRTKLFKRYVKDGWRPAWYSGELLPVDAALNMIEEPA